MTALLVFLSLILIAVIAIQIGKVTELAAKIRGEEEMQEIINGRQGIYMVVFADERRTDYLSGAEPLQEVDLRAQKI